MTQQEAELISGLQGRYIPAMNVALKPHHSNFDELNAIGDSFRCQLGRHSEATGIVTVRERGGAIHEFPWRDTVFELVGFGPDFAAAAEMAGRKQAAC